MGCQLALGDWLVQMDGLLLTERCAVVIESKNISGKIHFDLCRACKTLTMKRVQRSWTCAQCGKRDASAHEYAVREYFSLVGNELTNQEFWRFCGLESVYVASRLLSRLDLEASGELKARKYELKKNR